MDITVFEETAKTSLFIGAIVGIIVMIAEPGILKLIGKDEKFDEMQKINRGFAYQCTMISLLAYMIFALTMWQLKISWARFDYIIYIGLLLALTVFSFITIVKNAHMGFNRKHKLIPVITFAIVTIILMLEVIYLRCYIGINFIYNGQVTGSMLLLIIALWFLAMTTAHLIRYISDKRTAQNVGE